MSGRLRSVALTALLASACTTRVDPDTARAYRCTRDAGAQCPADWACGLDGRCHAPVPGAYACDDEPDCFGWHCGLAHVCYLPDPAQPYPCDPARESTRHDCAPAARCGLEALCHPTGSGAALRCAGDADCEGGWRCGPLGVCLDPALERPERRALPLTAERIAPALFDSAPDVFTVDIDRGVGYLLAHGPRVAWLHVPFYGTPSFALWTAPAPVQDAVLIDTSSWLTAGGALWRVDWPTDAGAAVAAPVDGGFQPVALIPLAGDYANPAWVAALGSDGGLALLNADHAWTPAPAPPGALRGLTAGDVTFYQWTLLASTSSGLFTAPFDPSQGVLDPWAPAGITFDGGDVPLGDADLGAFAFESSPFSLGGALLSRDRTRALRLVSDDNTGALLLEHEGACPLCPDGGTLAAVAAHNGTAQVFCRFPDRALSGVASYFNGCQLALTPPEDFGTPAATAPGTLATAHGTITNVLGVPAYLVGERHLGAAETGGRLVVGDLFESYVVEPGLGLVGGPTRAFCGEGSTRGAPWILGGTDLTGLLDDPPQTACAWSDTGQRAAVGTTAGGQRFTLIADEGTVYGAALAPRGSATPAPTSALIAPFHSVPVDDLVALDTPPDAGAFLLAYALGTNGAAELRGLTAQAWTAAPLPLPLGTWRGLLSDGHHAEVAYADGTLYSLPSRLAVAEPLPGGAQLMLAESFAGADFAATDAGLFRATPNPDGGVLGRWEPVPLPPSSSDPRASAGDAPLALLATDGALWVLTRWAVYRLTVDGGTP